MKRKIVQHGPSTLTVSLPSDFVREYRLQKGEELTIEPLKGGLFLTTAKGLHHGQKHISVRGMRDLIPKAVAALYKYGYDEIVVEYDGPDELEAIHRILSTGYIGFEVIDETKHSVTVRKVSEPAEEEFRTLFRRIFHFLLSTSEEGLAAAKEHDRAVYQKLILRDQNINKLADFCRRVVNKHMQNAYRSDTSLYHVIEQLEKIGDMYKELHQYLLEHKADAQGLAAYDATNRLLKAYDDLFFKFTLQKADAFLHEYDRYRKQLARTDGNAAVFMLSSIGRELYNLLGATIILNV